MLQFSLLSGNGALKARLHGAPSEVARAMHCCDTLPIRNLGENHPFFGPHGCIAVHAFAAAAKVEVYQENGLDVGVLRYCRMFSPPV